MVGTRNHPGGDYSPTSPTPTPRATAKSPAATGTGSVVRRSTRSAAATGAWTHTPTNATLLWMALSLPVVAWDTAYVLGRPATMPGGWAHAPLFTPYALYGSVDYVYGAPAFAARDGFGGAQAAMNVVESAGYAAYLAIVLLHGVQAKTRGKHGAFAALARPRVVAGQWAAVAPVLGLVVSAMTLAKTVLYMLNEVFSGFKNVGHNPILDLIPLWIIPNGMWLLLPTYMVYVFWFEVVEGLETASDPKKRN